MSLSSKITRSRITRSILAVALAGATMISTAVLTAAPAQAAAPVYYKLVGYGSNKCLDVTAEDGGQIGARIQLWQCYGSANQRFTLYPVGKTSTGQTYFQIISQSPGHLCMEIQNDSFSNGARIVETGCSADLNQYWRWGSGSMGGYSLPLVSMRTGKCLDISGGSTANGARVQQWDCNGTSAQYFKTVL